MREGCDLSYFQGSASMGVVARSDKGRAWLRTREFELSRCVLLEAEGIELVKQALLDSLRVFAEKPLRYVELGTGLLDGEVVLA